MGCVTTTVRQESVLRSKAQILLFAEFEESVGGNVMSDSVAWILAIGYVLGNVFRSHFELPYETRNLIKHLSEYLEKQNKQK